MTIRLSTDQLASLRPWDAEQIVDASEREIDEAEASLDEEHVHFQCNHQRLRRWVTQRRERIEEVRHELWGDDEQVVPKNGESRP